MLREWLSGELNRRGWSQNELGRRAGISQFAISSVLSGKRSPGAGFCVKIAAPLEVSPVYVLQLAGILPQDVELPPDIDSATTQEIFTLLRNLPPEKREEALQFLKFLAIR